MTASSNYIQTTYYPNEKTKIVAKISYTGGNPGAVFGAANANGSLGFWLTGTTSSGSTTTPLCARNGERIIGPLDKTARITYTMTKDGLYTGTDHLSEIGTFTDTSAFTCLYPLYIYNRNMGGTPSTMNGMSMRIHALDIYEIDPATGEDEHIMELRPAIQSDGVTLGLYDTIAGQWYLPNSQETFVNE